MKLNTRLVVHGILDDTQQTLVSTLSNHNRLANQPVAPSLSTRWRHPGGIRTCVEGRVDAAEIWALCLSPTTLGCHGYDVVASDHKDALVLN